MSSATSRPSCGPSSGPDGYVTGLSDDSAPVEAIPCQGDNPDLWFAAAPADLERAKALCGGCPIRVQCLAGALARHEPWGVWGGQIFERGSIIPRKRGRGRPRKQVRDEPVIPAPRRALSGREVAA